MGAYLSQPVKEKESSDGGNLRVRFGTSAMQGWRTSMEVCGFFFFLSLSHKCGFFFFFFFFFFFVVVVVVVVILLFLLLLRENAFCFFSNDFAESV